MPTESAEIDQLLSLLAEGDREALATLFSRYQNQLKRMIDLRLDQRLAGRISASDVVQETYLDAEQRLQHFLAKRDMPFFLWLRLVANQRLVDLHRRHLGAQMRDAAMELSIDRGPMAAASSMCLAAHLVAGSPSPSRVAENAELFAKVEEALASLDPIDREVLALRHFEELGNNEVAEILNLDKHAASKRYIRALGRLKEALANVPGFFDNVS